MPKPIPRAPIPRAQVARLLTPKSVAVIGVSERPGTAGQNCVATLDNGGFTGDVHLVSRNLDTLGKRKTVRSVAELPKGIDLAVLTVPGGAILQTVEELAERNVGAIMCFASGFAETGQDGAAAQARITEIAHANEIAFAGPNCLGFFNMIDGVHVTFSLMIPPPKVATDRRVDVVAQSGAMAAVLRNGEAAEGIGFNYSITTGNEAVLGIEDYLPFVIENDKSQVIMVLAETIRRPQEFLKHAAAARARKKPLVLLHLGRSAEARESAKTHTGALAGDYDIMESFVRSRDVVLVETLDEMIDTTNVLAHYPNPPAGGVGVVTDSGAFKGFALDYCESVGLPMAKVGPKTLKALKATLPDFVPAANPVDVTAQAIFDNGMYTRCVNALMNEPSCGGVLASIMAANPAMGMTRSGFVAEGKVDNGKPLLCAFMGGDQEIDPEQKPTLARQGIPFFRSPERALRALARANAYGVALKSRRPKRSTIKVKPAKVPTGGVFTEAEGKAALKAAGVRIPAGGLATSLAQAKKTATRIGYPVVIKAHSRELTHKSDAGGVIVNIGGPKELAAAWKKLHADVKKARPDIALDGVLVEKMAHKGVEMVVGCRRDPLWGPTLMIGLGGVFTEALKDVKFLPADASVEAITDAANGLKGAALLKGFRGSKPADVEGFAEAAARVAALMRATPELTDIDVNPLIVYAKGVTAVDALLIADE